MEQAVATDPRIALADRLFSKEPAKLPGEWYCLHPEGECPTIPCDARRFWAPAGGRRDAW